MAKAYVRREEGEKRRDMPDRRRMEETGEGSIEDQIKNLSANLFGLNPGMAGKVIAAAYEEMARLDCLRIKSEELAKTALVHMDAGRFCAANSIFAQAAKLKREIGDATGEADIREKQTECSLKRTPALTDVAKKTAEIALELYKISGDNEGIKRIESLMSH